MAGLTKLRIQPPICGGSTSAAYMRADKEATRLAQDLLRKLDYQGYFDLEFIRDDGDGRFYFIELNPRPGLPNYGATAVGVNFIWEGYVDQVGQAAERSCIINESSHVWIRILSDFFLYVIAYHAIGFGIRPTDWWRSLKGRAVVDAGLNFRDPLVIIVEATLLAVSGVRRLKRFLISAPRKLNIHLPSGG
jgi:predicted ATP-grasp superfamily ATP-dependent carboligase